nr:uncharacterized protein LOC106629759 [Zonotrichia albicollis]
MALSPCAGAGLVLWHGKGLDNHRKFGRDPKGHLGHSGCTCRADAQLAAPGGQERLTPIPSHLYVLTPRPHWCQTPIPGGAGKAQPHFFTSLCPYTTSPLVSNTHPRGAGKVQLHSLTSLYSLHHIPIGVKHPSQQPQGGREGSPPFLHIFMSLHHVPTGVKHPSQQPQPTLLCCRKSPESTNPAHILSSMASQLAGNIPTLLSREQNCHGHPPAVLVAGWDPPSSPHRGGAGGEVTSGGFGHHFWPGHGSPSSSNPPSSTRDHSAGKGPPGLQGCGINATVPPEPAHPLRDSAPPPSFRAESPAFCSGDLCSPTEVTPIAWLLWAVLLGLCHAN